MIAVSDRHFEKSRLGAGTYPGNHQGVISTPKHKIFGNMTPSCILQDFLYLFESKEVFQKFHS